MSKRYNSFVPQNGGGIRFSFCFLDINKPAQSNNRHFLGQTRYSTNGQNNRSGTKYFNENASPQGGYYNQKRYKTHQQYQTGSSPSSSSSSHHLSQSPNKRSKNVDPKSERKDVMMNSSETDIAVNDCATVPACGHNQQVCGPIWFDHLPYKTIPPNIGAFRWGRLIRAVTFSVDDKRRECGQIAAAECVHRGEQLWKHATGKYGCSTTTIYRI